MQLHAFMKRILRNRAKNGNTECQDVQSMLPKKRYPE